jgi:hypothetical protein
MDPEDRSRIVTILYNEVIRAQQAMLDTKYTNLKAHRTAQEALQSAVTRYTNFTLDGQIPEDLEATRSAGG